QAVQTTFLVGTLLPGSGVAGLRRTQHAGIVAGATVGVDHVVRRLGATTGGNGHGADALALFTLDADLAHRLDALGDLFVGRSLSAHSPQGQYGGLSRQHLLDQVHGTPSLARHARGHGFASGRSITVRPAGRNNPTCRRGIGLSARAGSRGSASIRNSPARWRLTAAPVDRTGYGCGSARRSRS